MHKSETGLNRATLILTVAIVLCLSVAALGGVVESPWLAYFWYLGLLGILALIVVSLLQGVYWLLEAAARRYHHLLLRWGGEAHGH